MAIDWCEVSKWLTKVSRKTPSDNILPLFKKLMVNPANTITHPHPPSGGGGKVTIGIVSNSDSSFVSGSI